MRPFYVDTNKSYYKIYEPRSTLYIKKKLKYDVAMALTKEQKDSLSYSITSYNFYDIKEIFEIAASWFEPDNIKELYGTNNEGMLVFNMDYKNLNVFHVDEFSSIKTSLKIVPCPVEVGYMKYVPGVVLYLNKLENSIILSGKEFLRLARFIINFDFLKYEQHLMNCFMYAKLNKSVNSIEVVEKRKKYDEMTNNSNSWSNQ